MFDDVASQEAFGELSEANLDFNAIAISEIAKGFVNYDASD